MHTQKDLLTQARIARKRNQLRILAYQNQALEAVIFKLTQQLGKFQEQSGTLAREIDEEERSLFASANLVAKPARRVKGKPTTSAEQTFAALAKSSGIPEREIVRILREELAT